MSHVIFFLIFVGKVCRTFPQKEDLVYGVELAAAAAEAELEFHQSF